MNSTQDGRIAVLEQRPEEMARRLERLEGVPAAQGAWAPPLPNAWAPPGAPVPMSGPQPPSAVSVPLAAPPRRSRISRPGTSLEDLVGGRLLAWAGGLAVVVGLALLFAVAVSRGWVGEGARTLLAGAGSAGLLGLGAWLHERRSRTDAALASVATGVAGLFLTATVGAQVYGVLPVGAALLIALATGAVATTLAIGIVDYGFPVYLGSISTIAQFGTTFVFVLIVLIWFYALAIVLLAGAILNALRFAIHETGDVHTE